MVNLKNVMKIDPEDQDQLNHLLEEIGTILARNNNQGLELDFQFWCETIFGDVTGFGNDDNDVTLEIPEVFMREYQ